MALADTADGRVAGHLPQGIDVVGQQQGAGAHARTGQGGLGTPVAAAYDNDIELLGVI